jgi:hypothetical protein
VAAEPFPVIHPDQVEDAKAGSRWLVEQLWSEQAVGFLAGLPKSNKTWLALDLAVSVASGTAALGRFNVPAPGPVLIHAAEDSMSSVRDRLRHIATARGIQLAGLDIGLVSTASLRLDQPRDRDRIRATLDGHKPRLLVLDPLVRLHRLDENASGDIAGLLGELRTMQREHAVAVLLVHHLRKNGDAGAHPGVALRGSGDLHAWGDSNLYLRHKGSRLLLSIEHRAAPPHQPIAIELATEPSPHLRVADAPDEPSDPTIEQRILDALAAAHAPVDRETLRQSIHARNQAVGLALVRLRTGNRVERCAGGFRLTAAQHTVPVPDTAHQRDGNAQAPPPPTA